MTSGDNLSGYLTDWISTPIKHSSSWEGETSEVDWQSTYKSSDSVLQSIPANILIQRGIHAPDNSSEKDNATMQSVFDQTNAIPWWIQNNRPSVKLDRFLTDEVMTRKNPHITSDHAASSDTLNSSVIQEGENDAAIRIQNAWRGYSARNMIHRMYQRQINILAEQVASLQAIQTDFDLGVADKTFSPSIDKENIPSGRNEHLEWRIRLLKSELDKTRQRYAEHLSKIAIKDAQFAELQERYVVNSTQIEYLQQKLNMTEKELFTCKYLLSNIPDKNIGSSDSEYKAYSQDLLSDIIELQSIDASSTPSDHSHMTSVLENVSKLTAELSIAKAALKTQSAEIVELKRQCRLSAEITNSSPTRSSVSSFQQSPQSIRGSPVRVSPMAYHMVHPFEETNYRRLLNEDRDLDWEIFVTRIVHSSDQQASIFLQQKLKIGTADQQCKIIYQVIAKAISLMTNRFGNFLVQRCFEYGNEQQQMELAEKMRGSMVALAKDPFGCHVVQKCFDSVNEHIKFELIHELQIHRVQETLTDKHASHVWQKVFELQWKSERPPKTVELLHQQIQGKWVDICLHEIGSLVVQGLLDNFGVETTQQIVRELITEDKLHTLATSSCGHWIVLQILDCVNEQKKIAISLMKYATKYSLNPFASKIIGKIIRQGGNWAVEEYLRRVSASNQLINIACDQNGYQVLELVVSTNVTTQEQRQIILKQIKSQLAKLQASPYGQKLANLIERSKAGVAATQNL